MIYALWIFLGLVFAFAISYVLEKWWMIGWATYAVSKIKVTYQRLVK